MRDIKHSNIGEKKIKQSSAFIWCHTPKLLSFMDMSKVWGQNESIEN